MHSIRNRPTRHKSFALLLPLAGSLLFTSLSAAQPAVLYGCFPLSAPVSEPAATPAPTSPFSFVILHPCDTDPVQTIVGESPASPPTPATVWCVQPVSLPALLDPGSVTNAPTTQPRKGAMAPHTDITK